MLDPKWIYRKSIFAKCTRLACLLSFASLFSLRYVKFYFTLMADYDQFWHVSAAFNWLHRAIMSVGPGKSKFWTRHLRFSTWKPPVNMGNSRFSTTFSSFDNLSFVLEIVWKPSVTFPLCLSHVRKLLVTLPLPFFMNCLQEQCKIRVRAAPSRGRF